jgi:PPOX class probable F420-dependent enzyme
MAIQLDTSTEFGLRVERRLRDEPLIWLTTISADGTPQPSPVWFLWDGEGVLIYSRPNTPKLRHIERNPRVALNLDGDGRGGDIVILTGQAALAPDAPPADRVPEYVRKYAWGFARIKMTAEQFGQTYSVAIRVTPTRLRGH